MKDGIYIVDILSNGTLIQGVKRRILNGNWLLTRYGNPKTHNDEVINIVSLLRGNHE